MAERKTILVVDDDPGSRRLLQFVLAKTGCEIITAPNGAQGLALASVLTIHLLVTDLMMEEMDGFQLTQLLRQKPDYLQLPVIILSARWQIDNQTISRHERIIFTSKPFSPIELVAQVNSLLKL